MAVRLYNGTNYDTVFSSPTMGASNVSLTTTFQLGNTATAPNTSNFITGVIVFVATAPSLGNFEVEIRQSGVTVATGTANLADIQLGFNFIQLSAPFQFTTTSANAYCATIRNTTNNSGAVARDGAAAVPLLAMVYDANSALGGTDDLMVMGFHNAGLTTKTLTLTGTSNSWGSGANKNISSTTSRVWGLALAVSNGGTVVHDTTADCTHLSYGSIVVWIGGLYDKRPSASNVTTLQFTNDADGDFCIMTAQSTYGGQILFTGKTVAVAATYASGVGTAANPVVVSEAAHNFSVGDEIVIGWSNHVSGNRYQQNEVRFIISIPAANQIVWSATAGGAEAALSYTHAAGYPICNMTRNSIVKNTVTTRGFSVYHSSTNVTPVSDFSYTRFEYANCLSGRGLQLSATQHAANIDGMVCYENSASGRSSVSWGGTIEQTSENIIMFNTRGSNYSAQSGIVFIGSSKTMNNVYHFAAPNSTTNCSAVSLNGSATGCRVDGLYSSGANAGNGTLGYALGVFGSGNSFNNIVIDAARVQGLFFDAAQLNEFTNCALGQVSNNTIDIKLTTDKLVSATFADSSFGSTTIIDNYTGALDGSEIAFQNMDGNRSKHRWYTNKGSFWSSGTGLTDTTVRTAGSLSLAVKPESATKGASFIFKVPANPESQVQVFGYLRRNAAFSSGDVLVELFLPRTLLTDTPDASYTLPLTTEAWLPWTLTAYYSAEVARYATVRITAKTAAAGAYVFLDDIYDAGLNNKVAGLDLWDNGKISPIMLAIDFSSVPEQTRLAVWSDNSTYGAGEKGYVLDNQPDAIRTEISTELGRIDVATSTRMAEFTYTAPPSISDIAAAVWASISRTLTGVGTSGIASQSTSDTILSNTDATQAKVDQL